VSGILEFNIQCPQTLPGVSVFVDISSGYNVQRAPSFFLSELCNIFGHIRTLIESRFKVHEGQHTDLPYQGISSFLFLRFFVPTILKPHEYGMWHG
jgi:hypothetical protein